MLGSTCLFFVFFKQKTAYEMRISDWSSDVCSSDLHNDLDDATEHSPVETLEHALHPWVAYGILPLFAFVNAGLVLGGLGMDDLLSPLPLGIAIGLVLGDRKSTRLNSSH